jgi:hypothetical protein
MRIGTNPSKNDISYETIYFHQIIIPVYIPNNEDYFVNAFKIFKICLQSLLKTIHTKTYITIVNNGSNIEVVDYLNSLYKDKIIHEVIHTDNIGKFNAIVKGISGRKFRLVTIADADVLFLKNWQNATYEVYNKIPRAGIVGLVPQFRSFGEHSTNLIFEKLFSNKLKFTNVDDPDGLKMFYESLGWGNNYNQDYLKYHLTFEQNGCKTVVGSGHFVATYRGDFFETIKTHSNLKMGPKILKNLDSLPLYHKLWRLTTSKNHAYHMGNYYEKWMDEEVQKLNENNEKSIELVDFNQLTKENKISFYIKNKLFRKLFNRKEFRRFFYKIKDLPKSSITKY